MSKPVQVKNLAYVRDILMRDNKIVLLQENRATEVYELLEPMSIVRFVDYINTEGFIVAVKGSSGEVINLSFYKA